MLERLRRWLHPIFRRAPALREFALDLLDLSARPVLLPFRLGRPIGPSDEAIRALEAQTDQLNAAAERYFAHADPQHLLDKPFSEPDALSRRLIDLGVLLDGMRLRPGDVVLELGAGSCWVSQWLNRYGCRTVAVDVSPTALALGRRVFERDPRTDWTRQPEFLHYDGRNLPLPDGSVDRVVVYDAYHHLPNPGAVLHELRRVLRADGIVAMSEPGRGHAESAVAHMEAATGVLENELALEQIADTALASGFAAARVVIASHRPLAEIDAHDLRAFMGGRGFARYWKELCAALDGHHYILLFAGDPQPTTARPRRLTALIDPIDGRSDAPLRVPSGERLAARLRLHNGGDTTWIAAEGEDGWTRLGAHLYRRDAARTLVDFDWLRAPLPGNIEPGQACTIEVDCPAIADGGRYLIAFDCVIEGVAWFADRGSPSLEIACDVQPW